MVTLKRVGQTFPWVRKFSSLIIHIYVMVAFLKYKDVRSKDKIVWVCYYIYIF